MNTLGDMLTNGINVTIRAEVDGVLLGLKETVSDARRVAAEIEKSGLTVQLARIVKNPLAGIVYEQQISRINGRW